MIRLVLVAALALGVALGPSVAWATPISLGETITLTFDGANGTPSSNSLVQGTGSITVTALTATSVTFDISLTNTTISTLINTRFSGFGFEMTPAPTAFADFAPTDTGGGTDTDAFIVISNNSLPNFSAINVCAYASNNCNAGSTGLLNGQTDEFSFSLSGSFLGSVDLSLIALRVTGCDGCGFEIPAGVGPTGPPPIPLPGTLVLLGLGLSGFMVAERLRSLRRKK